MKNQLVWVVLLFTLPIIGANQLAADEAQATLEFRLADDDPASGWEKLTIRDGGGTTFVSKAVVVSGDDIKKVSFFADAAGNPTVGITLTDAGAKQMAEATAKHLKKRLAIVLNGTVVSAPVIQSTISKQGQISGNFDEADLLAFFQAIVLRAER